MRKFILAIVIVASSLISFSQNEVKHKVVLQLSSNDTMVYKGLFNNLFHLKEGYGETLNIEVIMHGPGIELMQISKSKYQSQVAKWTKENVKFIVCENTMKNKKVSKEDIFTTANFAAMGLGYIIERQEQGWSYIKIGF
jgi:intracellular sulfur oxidation DsrE/DsrF family protein